jgi:hypothetical protein
MKNLTLYKLTNMDKTPKWDFYDSAIVAAFSIDEAKNIYPDISSEKKVDDYQGKSSIFLEWPTDKNKIEVELIGTVTNKNIKPGVILASYNAG